MNVYNQSDDRRSAREKIADALIPEHCGLLRAAYLLGDDRVLLRFLTIPECGGLSSVGREDAAPFPSERFGILPFLYHFLHVSRFNPRPAPQDQ
jgi:hypothetical protein